MILQTILTATGGYLLGSISFGIIISTCAYKDDIRSHGSGNAGMTNALRTYGAKTAVWVFLGDFIKGVLAVLAARMLAPPEATVLLTNVAALAVVLGHLFPVFFGFRGGKGVATAAGAILALNLPVLLVCLVPFGILVVTTRYMSLAAMTAAGLLPFATLAYQLFGGAAAGIDAVPILFATAIGGLIIFMHRANIGRLLAGTESKLWKNKKSA